MSFELSKTIRDLIDIDWAPVFTPVPLDAQRIRSLSNSDISLLLVEEDVRFVVSDHRVLRHIPAEHTDEFWISNVRGNVVAPERIYVSSSSFISGFYYRASEWHDSVDMPIVLLELGR